MTTVAEYFKINDEHLSQTLNEVREKLGADKGDVVLDFSAVLRVDTGALQAIEELASVAESQSVRVEFRGVNVSIYKVLKLARLTSRLSFVN